MSIQPVPPSTGPTTAGQLAARATQNDQALAAWLGDVEGRVETLESVSGTSGSGILNVSGTVNLDDVAGIREVYATAAATVEGVALTAGDAAVFRYLAGAWTYMIVGTHTTWQTVPGAPPADTTNPTPGTLTVTGTGDAGSTRTLTVTGASDAGGLHATPYRFSTNGGTTWSAYQASNAFTTAALTAGTYQPRAMVRDAAGNTATAAASDFTVAAAPGLPITDDFTGTDGAFISNRPIGSFTWMNYGAGLHTGQDPLKIVSNRAGQFSNGKINQATVDVGDHLIRASATLRAPDAATAGNVARRITLGTSISNTAAFNGASVLFNGSTWFLQYGTGGAMQTATITQPTGLDLTAGVVVSIENNGTQIIGKAGGQTLGAVTVALTGTMAGISIGQSAAPTTTTFDDFTVEFIG